MSDYVLYCRNNTTAFNLLQINIIQYNALGTVFWFTKQRNLFIISSMSLLKRVLNNFYLFLLFVSLIIFAMEAGFRIFPKYLSEITFKGEALGTNSLYKISQDAVLVYELKDKNIREISSDDKNILVLGDSTSYLTALPETYFYANKLEKLLRADNRPINVINAAVPGYNTRQEIQYLEKYYLNSKPSLVVLGYCAPNDRSVKRKIIKYADGVYVSDIRETVPCFVENPQAITIFLLRHSEIYKFLNMSLKKIALRYKVDFLLNRMRLVSVSEETKASLNRLKQLSGENSFDVLVLIFPLLSDEGVDDESDWIVSQCEALDLKYIDFRTIFFDKGLGTVKVSESDICHFNAYGHELVAEAVFAKISS